MFLMEGGKNVKINQYINDIKAMKPCTQISYKIKWDQLDIFITKTITFITLFPATAISPYLSILV